MIGKTIKVKTDRFYYMLDKLISEYKTQTNLSNYIYISQQTFSLWINNEHSEEYINISEENFTKLMIFLGIPKSSKDDTNEINFSNDNKYYTYAIFIEDFDEHFNNKVKPYIQLITLREENKNLKKYINDEKLNKLISKNISSNPYRYIINICEQRLVCLEWVISNKLLCLGGFSGDIYILNTKDKSIKTLKCAYSTIRCISKINGNSIIIGDDKGKITYVNINKMETKELFQTNSTVFSISLLLQSKRLYTAERNGDVIEWHFDENNLELIKLRTLLNHKGSVFEVYFEEETKTCISIDTSGYLKFTNLSSSLKNEIQVTNHSLLSLDIKKDNILIGDDKGSIFFGQINNINEFFSEQISGVRGVCLSKNSKWFCSASRDGVLRLHNIDTKQNWILYKIHDYLYDVTFSFDYTEIIACTGDGNVIFIKLDKEIDKFTVKDMDKWYEKNYF